MHNPRIFAYLSLNTKLLSISDEAAVARANARAQGLTQLELAQALGIEQSQVSRLLSGKVTRRTPAFIALCEFLAVTRTPAELPLPESIEGAVRAVWDGTTRHAAALATVIRTLAVLKGPNGEVSR